MLTHNSANTQSANTQTAIAVPTNPNSLVPQNLPAFDPYSPFWILIGLAILLEKAKTKRAKSGSGEVKRWRK